MIVGDRIKQRRLALELTVEELANKLGKNRATIYRYESNDIKNMPTTVLEPLADALYTTPAYLMGWTDEPDDWEQIANDNGICPPNDFDGDPEDWFNMKISQNQGVADEHINKTFYEEFSPEIRAAARVMMELSPDETKMLCENTATPEEFERIIKKYRSLDHFGQETVSYVLDREVQRTKEIAEIKSKPNNIIEFTSHQGDVGRLVKYFRSASAGSGVFIMGGEGDEQIPIPDTPQNRKVDYAIKVSGDSMNPDFHDGDTVLVSHKEELRHGDVGIFIVNNHAYIKEYGKEELISRNPEAENIKISEHDNIVCMGKVIGKL